MHTSTLHCQPTQYQRDFDLLFSDLLHASSFQEPSSAVYRAGAGIFTYFHPTRRELCQHILADWL